MRHRILLSLFLFVSGLLPLIARATPFEVREVSTLQINSAITPATLDYLQHHFERLPENVLIVIKLNTPGGLVTTTKEIITLIGQQERPVVVWITPEGASASSAGAIIASSAHFIFMSPGTNMGAATPVGMGDDIKEGDLRNKALNDLSALVRSQSQKRNRPSKPFEEMITKSTAYTDKEALKLKIIDGVISLPQELTEALEGKTFSLHGQDRTIQFKPNTPIKAYEQTTGQKVLEVLANPSLAYFLFLIGAALIYFELQAPGGMVAGLLGVGFLILAAIAFQVLPLDWGAFGLIILGLGLFILEIFVTSYGLLTIGGLVSLVIGSLFLFHGEGGFISVEYPVILSTLAGVFVSVALMLWYLYQDQKKQPQAQNFFLPEGATGTVFTVSSESGSYQIKVRGEIWRAYSSDDLNIGDKVEITKVDSNQLLVQVKKVSNS